ncbi:hypothetical protein [Nitratireductor soli]|uniref:hypothetical protein n=1 Tax=Nitratireductor soli TaxID=1670619 RepID=UPI0012FADED8|nr:hypothetical protein [Nitratireductor soli]
MASAFGLRSNSPSIDHRISNVSVAQGIRGSYADSFRAKQKLEDKPVLDPFSGVPRLGDIETLSTWLADEMSISTFELWCLLNQIERSCRQFEAMKAPIPIRTVYARRVMKAALRKRLAF